MTEPADQPVPAKPGRSLTGFYVAICVLLVLGLLGAWLLTASNRWWFDAYGAQRQQAEASRQLGVPVEKVVDLGGGVALELVLVPAGRFQMGSPEDEKERGYDEAQHWVRITRPFYMGKYEVTQEVWEKVMGTNPSLFKGAKNPVEGISWDDCQDFLKKLNALEKEQGAFRLPTEAEWEWACRAGTKTRFCSEDADGGLSDFAWYDANSGGTAHPVGAKHPNAWGLFDCHGNVLEWCQDWYGKDYYGKSAKDDPVGPATGSHRVLRGGSWYNPSAQCHSATRGDYAPYTRPYNYGGLRVLVAVPSRGP